MTLSNFGLVTRLVAFATLFTLGSGAVFAGGPLPDTDSDGVNDYADNCLLVANPLQIDTDGDGFGNFCDADFNQDNFVNLLDLGMMRVAFFNFLGDPNYDPDIDMNSDGGINFPDLNLMKTGFYEPPGPGAINAVPTDILLDNASVDENEPAGTPVGTFSTTDLNPFDTHTYSLVAGTGDTDNASFGIVGDGLQTAAIFNFETQSSFSIRVQTDDGNGGQYEEVFTITVNDLNDDPTDIALNSTSVDENQPSGTAVGTFSTTDEDSADTHTYTLVAGAGDTDNGSFGIAGDVLETAAIFDFETQSSFSIRVQTDDGNGGQYEEVFTITVNDLNDAPTDIALDSTSVDELQPPGTAVGNFSTTDVDSAGPFTYTLVAGAGDADNAAFGIVGGQLQTAAIFDFETQSSFSIRVQTDDGSGGLYQEVFTITVNDLNDDPTDIALDNNDVDENQPVGTAVGTFSSTDVDSAGPFTYTLVAGAGDADNASFGITGDVLETAAIFDFETQSSYSIRVQTDDGSGGLYEEVFTITVNDLNDDPTDIALDNNDVDENQPVGTAVGTLSTTDVDSAGPFTYTLVAGAGDTDNASFGITGSVLETAAIFDFETQSSFSIRVQTDDGSGGLYAEVFTITVNDLNDDPTDIALDSTDVDEDQPAGTAVGTFSTTDIDSAGPFTYTLVAGTGDTDNASFGVSGDVLETAAIFDFDVQSSFSIRVQTDDGAGGVYEEVFTITVNSLNSDPTDIALSNSSVDENEAIGTVVGMFTTTDADPDTHTYTFVAGAGDTGNGQFTIDGDQLKTAAIFDFEAQSSYSVRVQTDDGNGGLYEEAFTITVNDLNEDPTDIALDNADVDENEPVGTAVGSFTTTDMDPADSHTYTLVAGAGDTDNAQFMISGAQLQTAAVLNFEAATNCITSATTCSIRVQTDDGNGGVFQKSFIININNINDAPVATDDPYTGAIGNVRFALVTALSGTTPVPPTVELVGDIDTNDTDEDSGDTLTVTANASIPTLQGGTVSVDGNGQFVYSPPAGFPGSGIAADSFTYEVCDNGAPSLCDNGTVTIEGTSMVWFVDDLSPNNPGLGTSDDPFRDLSSAGGPSLAGEPIFVHSGTQTTGITLKNNQSLLGEGVALVVGSSTLVDAGTRPVISSAGTAVTLGSGNTIRGLDIIGSNTGIVGNAFGTLTADNIAISTTGGPGIDLTSGACSFTFDSLSSSGSATSGIDLDSVTGSCTLGSGAISGSNAPGIDITSSTATVSYSGTVAAGSDLAVNINGHTANSVSLSGNITSSGQGILLNANTGGTINLSGGMSLSTGAFTAFSATNGGTVNVTGTNTVTTSTATAVAIVGTTIGGSSVTFQSITSTGTSANAAIILDNTGAGTFTIAGTGSSGSGGLIDNKTDTAVTFNNTDGRITFNDLIIEDIGALGGTFNTRSGHDGIHGQDVNGGLTLDNVIIRRISDNCVNGSLFSNGIDASFWDGLDILNSTIEQCNRFHVASVADTQDEGGVRIAGLTGTVTIDNNTFDQTGEHLDLFTHSSGTLNMTVTNNFFIDAYQEYNPPGAVVSVGGFCVDVTVEGSSDANVTIGGAGGSNDFENCGTGSIRVTKDTVPAGNSDIDFIVDNNTFRVTDQTDASGTFGNTPQGGVLLRAGPGGIATFDGIVSNNTFGIAIGPDDRLGSTGEEIANADGVGGNVVLIFDSGVSQARVNNNVFNGSLNAPWVNRADGNTSAAVLYKDNSYRGRDDYCCDSGFAFTVPGIPYRTQSRNGGSLDITFENDQMVHHDQFFFAATETLEFLTRNDSGLPGGTMCMAFKNAAAGDGYEFKETSGTLELYQGAVNNAATSCAPPHGTPCEAEMADDGARGGASNHAGSGGAPTIGLNPPHVDVDGSNTISITATQCTLPSGGIFN